MKRRGGLIQDIRRNGQSYLMLLPAVIFVFIYGYCTLPYALIAFKEYNYKDGLLGSPWNGLENFRFFFRSTDVWIVTRNTIWLNLLFLFFTLLVAVMLAVMLNELRFERFKKISQAIMILPNLLSWVVISYIVYGILGYEHGFLNSILKALGHKGQNWYNMSEIWVFVLVLVRVWQGSGYNMVIFLATLTGMDDTVNEAAMIDGATRLQRIWYITLPLLMPTVCIMLLMSVGRIFNGDFGMIYALVGDNGILLPKVDVIDTYVYRMLRQMGEPSWATAVGLCQSLMGFVMIFLSNWLVKKKFSDGALF